MREVGQMYHLRSLAAVFCLLALGACGSHRSVAPVVYGTEPTSTARVYNSPEEAAAATRPAPRREAAYTPPARSAPTANIEPVSLQPVSTIYLSDEERSAKQAAYTPSRRTASSVGTVTVQKGDTVYGLSRRYGVSVQEIVSANRLRSPYTLSIGQSLKVPDAGQQTTAVETRLRQRGRDQKDARHIVAKGDTLYSISRETGVPVKTLASANRLRAPYILSPGQQLKTPGAKPKASARVATLKEQPKRTPQKLAENKPAKQVDVATLTRKASYTPPIDASATFGWPVRGNIIAEYGVGELGRRNDGINIAAPAGTPVRAAADGEVVYRGSGLDGFGNLLLVKHTDGFVSAYAHNDAMIVKKGDVVRKGQVIAKVGQTGSVTTPQLHFEIRQKLKSVDPLAFLDTK